MWKMKKIKKNNFLHHFKIFCSSVTLSQLERHTTLLTCTAVCPFIMCICHSLCCSNGHWEST